MRVTDDEAAWRALRARLAEAAARDDPTERTPAWAARAAAALALLGAVEDGDRTLVYTRRRHDLRSHPGQVSFPGGRIDPGETVEQAALREAEEEVALDPATVTTLGRLPAFYIPPSRFWLTTVVARWHAPHPLVAAEAEVAEVLAVRLSTLLDEGRWRGVRLRERGWSWAWQLDDRHLLWGATGFATTALLDLLVPGWSGGRRPRDLPLADPER